jgi:hypothetical protein
MRRDLLATRYSCRTTSYTQGSHGLPTIAPSLRSSATDNLTPTREPNQWHADRPPSEDVVELEVADDGAVRVMTTRLGDDPGGGRGQVVFEDILPDLVRRTIGIAVKIAELTGYLGPWMLGVAATSIAGKPAYGSGRINFSTIRTFGTDHHEYRRYTEASALELQQTPGAVNQRLVGRFLRSIGFDNARSIRPLLEDTAT